MQVVASEIVASRENQNLGEYHIKLDIQTLVTMLLGYKRPLYLRSINRLKANDESIDKLEEILPEGKAYFSDYFWFSLWREIWKQNRVLESKRVENLSKY